MKYRSRTEIIAMILKIGTTASPKTKIMYKAFLSYAQLKEYLEFLQEKNLMDYDPATRLYRITQKGRQFLDASDEISGLISSRSEIKLINV